MDKLKTTLRFVFAEFGPLIVFWALALSLGTKAAIAGAVAVVVGESGWRLWRGLPFTRLYLVVGGLTLAFGAVDLAVASPFLLPYEAPITNVLTGFAFVGGAFGAKPMVMEFAQARPGADIPDSGEMRRFFRLFTLVWAGYFFLKAAAYLWLAATLPLQPAMALRSVLGSLSLGLLIALSVTQGRRLFFMFRRLGWLGEKDTPA